MNSYKIPEDILNKVRSINNNEIKKKKLEEIYSKLDDVSKNFIGENNYIKPDEIKLEKIEFKKPTYEEIEKKSVDKLNTFKNSEISKINKEFKQLENQLYSNKKDSFLEAEKVKNKLDGYYENAKENSEDEAIKRGLQRSSIILNELNAFDKDKIADFKKIDDNLKSEINAINFKLNALDGEKTEALNNFNLSYAIKLQNEIDKLNNELSEKEKEVKKYNNEITLKETEFNNNVDKLKNEIEQNKNKESINLVELYGKYGPNVVEKVRADLVYVKAKELFNNLDKDAVLMLLEDEGFKKRLGQNYEKLYKEFA